MDFAGRKAAALAVLSSPAPDKFPKGGVDAPIAPLLKLLNSHPDLFTTSSCSGRVSILAQSQVGHGPKQKKKARGGGWVYVSHNPADPEAVVELLFGGSGSVGTGDELVFRFEPMIVAVECRDAPAAVALVAAAVSAGFRESGITSLQKRAMVAIRCWKCHWGRLVNLLFRLSTSDTLLKLPTVRRQTKSEWMDFLIFYRLWVASCQMVQEIVHWNFLWGITDGLPIMKMASFIHLTQQNACSLMVTDRRNLHWTS